MTGGRVFVYFVLVVVFYRCNEHTTQLPLRDVLDVERSGKTVWVKCLHLGTVGFEATLENDSVIFYLAMDSLLNKRCGVQEGDVCIPGPLASA